MANDWIIDVLADLKTFASENGLVALAGQLDDTMLVATAEVSSTGGAANEMVSWDVGNTGRNNRTVTAG